MIKLYTEFNKLLGKYISNKVDFDIYSSTIRKNPIEVIKIGPKLYKIDIDFYVSEYFFDILVNNRKDRLLSTLKKMFIDEFGISLDKINTLKGQKYVKRLNMEVIIKEDEYYKIYSLLKISK